MKLLRYIYLMSILAFAFTGCEDDDFSNEFVKNIQAPTEVTADFNITQDDTGLVTIMPTGKGVVSFRVYFGDTTNEEPSTVNPGESVDHIYGEGNYTVKVIGVGLSALTSEFTQDLTVSFRAPENLAITIDQNTVNPSIVTIGANADFATLFDVYFGDVDDEEPTVLMPGETVEHTYTAIGDYTIKVVAKGAGAATSETTEIITIPDATDPIALPITFESFTVNYGFSDFGGAFGEVVDNPDPSGVNTTAKVGQFTKTAGAETWAGTFLQLVDPIDFSTNKLFKVKVYSPKSGATVKLKVENGTDGNIGFEVDAVTTVTNEWEELEYDFSAIDTNNEYHKVVIFFDFGNNGDDSVYYFDTINLASASLPSTSTIESFEGVAPTFTMFGNIADTQVVSNPDASGVNTTANVAQFTKTAGAETWAGTFFEFSTPLDLVTYSKISVKTWSPKNGAVVKLKLENVDASITHEVDLNTTVSNAWEELIYDFSAAPVADYVRVVIFFDFGNTGDDSIYYYDEVELYNEDGGSASLSFENFEGTAPVFTMFGNIADTQVVSNPDISGVNTTENVAQLTKTAGAETWAGTFFEFSTPLDLVTYSKISVKTWSPTSGGVVKVKLENVDSSITHEVDLNSTVANAWEELVYDFSAAPTAEYVRAVIFFDFGNAGDDSVYYFDEYELTN